LVLLADDGCVVLYYHLASDNQSVRHNVRPHAPTPNRILILKFNVYDYRGAHVHYLDPYFTEKVPHINYKSEIFNAAVEDAIFYPVSNSIHINTNCVKIKGKGKAFPLRPIGPRGFWEV
jgi:hypothetical protein